MKIYKYYNLKLNPVATHQSEPVNRSRCSHVKVQLFRSDCAVEFIPVLTGRVAEDHKAVLK